MALFGGPDYSWARIRFNQTASEVLNLCVEVRDLIIQVPKFIVE